MKTLVIYCFDPRAADIPQAVAAYLGDEIYPGEMILDEAGKRVGSTRTLFTATNGGGRAEPVLMSVAEMDYLFHVQNVVVVHHSFCGTTAFTPEVLFENVTIITTPISRLRLFLRDQFRQVDRGRAGHSCVDDAREADGDA